LAGLELGAAGVFEPERPPTKEVRRRENPGSARDRDASDRCV
jgi:hypothetical protein